MDLATPHPMTPMPQSPAAVSPLSPEQQKQFAKANIERGRITKAAGMAAFNGWSLVIFAIASAPFAMFSVGGAVVAISLGLFGFVELHGRNRILQLDPAAGRMLMANQLALLTAVLIYCAWCLYTGLTGPSELDKYPELKQMHFDYEGLQRSITLVLYGTVAAGSAIFQGLCALYYHNTGTRLRDYIDQTPSWIIQLQRGG